MDQTTIAVHGGAVAFPQATLLAAGAWALGTPLACLRCDSATIQAAYDEGLAGGQVRYRVMLSIDEGTSYFQDTSRQLVGVAPPTTAEHQDVPEEASFTSSADGEQQFKIPVTDLRATHFRLDAREDGNPGTPGVFAANIRFFRADGR